MRKIKFYNEEYYHIYNRGVDKRKIFMDEDDYQRFLRSMEIFSETKSPAGDLVAEKRVDIICYCLNPNHYHFILKQLQDKGIEKFMHKLGLGYTSYFNQKYDRSGALFQGTYQAMEVKDNSGLLWLSGYVNGNSEIHGIAKAEDYQWSSYSYYLNKKEKDICKKEDILEEFKNIEEYRNFVQMVIKEVKLNKAERKGYMLE
jgi:putative transposase